MQSARFDHLAEAAPDNVGEPFRSDEAFWTSMLANVDALIGIVVATFAAAALRMAGAGPISLLPFLAAAALIVRAAMVSVRSSRTSQSTFADRDTWRDAERQAVAGAFATALRHRFTR